MSSNIDFAPRTIGTDELAEAFGVTERTIRNLVNRGELRTLKVGKSYRFRAEDIELFEREHVTAPTPNAVDAIMNDGGTK